MDNDAKDEQKEDEDGPVQIFLIILFVKLLRVLSLFVLSSIL